MVDIAIQSSPNKSEIKDLLDTAFSCLIGDDSHNFTQDNSQNSLEEWFDLEAMIALLFYGKLIEMRNAGELIGVAFVAKGQPISWPDCKKAELFILAVDPKGRGKGYGKMLLERSEHEAKRFGAQKLLINTNALMRATVGFYEKHGYQTMGTLKNYYDNGDAIFLAKDL